MIRKNISLLSILIIGVSIFLVPYPIEAKTIKEFENEVNKYTSELQAKKDKVAKNDAEVAEIKKRIANIEAQIKQAETDIANLEQEIKKNEEEIAVKKEESKKIMEYYQIANGDNAYLEYAFGSTSITDMIYRMSVVEQLTEYNDQVMKELKALITKNEKQKQSLAQKKTELDALKKSLQSEKERIDADTAAIKAGMPSLEEQLKAAKDNLKYYKSLGCGNTEDIQACQYRIEQSSGGSIPSTNGFYRPIDYGYISCGYGCYAGHKGVDMISSNRSIAIHPIATGTVFKIYYDNCNSKNCGFGCNGRAKVVKIRHNVGGSYIYSTYAHLSNFGNISEGMTVTPNTIIGYMGNSGCSTGAHLHLEIATCDWNPGGGCIGYNSYLNHIVNPNRYIIFPARWDNR